MPYGGAIAAPPSSPAAAQTGNTAGAGAPGQSEDQGLQRWSVVPSVEVGEIYVNSQGRISNGGGGEYYVTEANPQLSVSGKSRRLALNVKYRMQNFFYAQHKAADATYHQLIASGKSTLISNFLYLDASSRMSQQIISPTERIPLGNFSVSGNRTNVRTYAVSPYVHYNFGTTASTTVRYSRQRLTYSNRSQYDNNANIYSVSLSSGPTFDRLSWGVSGYKEKILYDAFPSVSFESANGQLGWLVSRTLRLQSSFGYDKNSYQSAGRRTSGKQWSLGLEWSPGVRTSLSLSYGRRYFGNIYSMEFRHRARLATWSASYSVQPRTIRGLQNSSVVLGLINPTGQVTLVNFHIPTVTQQVYITKRGRLSVSRKLRGGSLNISLYDTRREYQETGEHTDYFGTRDSLTRKFGQRSQMTLSGAWVRYNYLQGKGYDYWYAGLDYSRQLGRNVQASLRYLYSVHSSSASITGYSENVVAAYLDITL